jgi:transcriptional regulator with XRE-family HTH domain
VKRDRLLAGCREGESLNRCRKQNIFPVDKPRGISGLPLSIEGAKSMTTVGQRIREIRKSRNLTQRELADRVGINFTYLSRVENDRLDDEQTPREETLQRIAKALNADPDELLLLARRIPDSYRDRILSRPGVFRKLLNLSDADLEDLIGQLEQQARGL